MSISEGEPSVVADDSSRSKCSTDCKCENFWYSVFVVAMVLSFFVLIAACASYYRMGVESVWTEAESLRFAVKEKTSAGMVYRWKKDNEFNSTHWFWEEAIKRGYAERVEWPEGFGQYRWKESNENTTDR